MEQQSAANKAAEMVTSALNRIEAENRHLKDVRKAFGGILVEQARWKSELPDPACAGFGPPDPARFAKGVPVTGREQLIRLGELWQTAASRLMPAMATGFPKVRSKLERLQAAILDGSLAPDAFLSAALAGNEKEALAIAEQIEIEAELLGFVLIQAAKPVVEKRAEALQRLIKDHAWNQGYCPICGSPAELSLLKEKEGQRWLRCGFCAGTWRFHRTCCPFCDTQDPGDIEIIFVEGREHERVDACQKCRKYIPGIDTRSLANEVVPEVAGLGLLHLDAIAQEKGFFPISGNRWNLF